MANLNKVFLMGNLTADPELRYTPKGTAVTDIRLAINRYYAGDNSERQEETTFVDVTLWNRQAEVAGNYLSKGRGVFVEGRLQLDSWEDKASGQKRTKLRVIGENISSSPAAVKAIWEVLRASSTRMLPVPITTDNPARPRTTTRPPCPPPISRLTTLETWTTKSRSKRKYLLFFLQAAFPPGQAVFFYHHFPPEQTATPCCEGKKRYSPIPGNGEKARE